MARRFTSVPGIGRCTVVLEGVNPDRRQRVRLVSQTETRRVYLVSTPASAFPPDPVTGYPTVQLLERLQEFDWWLPLGPVLDENDED